MIPSKTTALTVRAQAVKSALDGAFSRSGSDLQKARGTVLIGRIAYYLYVLCCLAAILAASVPPDAGSRRNPWIVLKNAGTLIYDAVTLSGLRCSTPRSGYSPIPNSSARCSPDSPSPACSPITSITSAAWCSRAIGTTRGKTFAMR